MLPSCYVASLKNFAWETQQQTFWIKITTRSLSYELGLHGEKNLNENSGKLGKIDIVKMTQFKHC